MTQEGEEGLDPRFAEATAAITGGDAVAARDLLMNIATLGSPRAFLALGALYEHGAAGVPRDYAAAHTWYERAWREGHLVAAALALGKMHYHGLGVDVDYERARTYYLGLEQHGDPVALLRLGVMSEIGRGAPKDLDMARKYYSRAASRGNIFAAKNLGVLEARSGNPLGILRWFWAAVHGTLLILLQPKSDRLKTG